MANTSEQHPEYVLEKQVNDTLHFVRRAADGVRYLAKEYNARDYPELLHLREEKPDDKIIAFEAAARVLNHENLISIVKPIRPVVDRAKDNEFLLVYEFCADGNLQQLFDKPPMEVVPDYGFLPEGLVWHVALSMLRALAFLHEGWREKILLSGDDDTVIRRWYCPDDDWMPIIHRSIRPENIHFQARKGKETYGLCKLGDFGRCVVTGTARVPRDNNIEVVAMLNNLAGRDVGPEEIQEMWYTAHANNLYEGVEGVPDWESTLEHGRLYTIGSELADLGAILYRMMDGNRLDIEACRRCGCFHIDPEPPGCICECSVKDVYLDQSLKETKYSDGLREVVIDLIRLNRENSARAYTCYEKAWGLYRKWKDLTAEGQAHFDHYDDLVARKLAEKRRKLDERKRELGDEKLAEQELAAKKKDEDLLAWE
ncbi:hypothetical protein CONLIGDRAFT_685099 [Coniochaeta ligniaria NRRL 30616]|uniref:non-specific serine/threonine protein kinase n=1 Tax=Coniochaeta ligniaria NRRL 30616 TaxID=1408157 RepID=A0A1J7J611_9PEZI|nr:hypothetical protein CONLIGDRAFT_685099 [Coniochaeta ligniaria NRRL 30616]